MCKMVILTEVNIIAGLNSAFRLCIQILISDNFHLENPHEITHQLLHLAIMAFTYPHTRPLTASYNKTNIYFISRCCIRVQTDITTLLNILPIFTLYKGKPSYPLVLEGNKVKRLPTILPGNYRVMGKNYYPMPIVGKIGYG